MEQAMSIMINWSNAKSRELTNKDFNIRIDNPTVQAFEIKEYNAIANLSQEFIDYLEFEELLRVLTDF
jgi:hypothetical protein